MSLEDDFKDLIEYMKEHNYLDYANESIAISESEFFNKLLDILVIPQSLQGIISILLNQGSSFTPDQCSIMINMNLSIPCDPAIIITGK